MSPTCVCGYMPKYAKGNPRHEWNGTCLSPDAPMEFMGAADDGYKAATFLWQTPFNSVTEWSQAQLDAIPANSRCLSCKGSGSDVILASNGGVGEIVRCLTCQGSGRR